MAPGQVGHSRKEVMIQPSPHFTGLGRLLGPASCAGLGSADRPTSGEEPQDLVFQADVIIRQWSPCTSNRPQALSGNHRLFSGLCFIQLLRFSQQPLGNWSSKAEVAGHAGTCPASQPWGN